MPTGMEHRHTNDSLHSPKKTQTRTDQRYCVQEILRVHLRLYHSMMYKTAML